MQTRQHGRGAPRKTICELDDTFDDDSTYSRCDSACSADCCRVKQAVSEPWVTICTDEISLSLQRVLETAIRSERRVDRLNVHAYVLLMAGEYAECIADKKEAHGRCETIS